MRFFFPISAFFLGLAGCATCHHGAGDRALEEARCPEVSACQRMKVYAILVKGFDPLDLAGAESLREGLIERGFPKVFRIECHHAAFIEKEAARILCEQPDARFVIVGSGSGAMLARALANKLPSVDAVVEIAPVLPSLLGQYNLNANVRHVVIGRVGLGSYSPSVKTEYRIVPGLARLTPCPNPLVVEMIQEQLMISAQNTATIDDGTYPTMPLLDHRAPMPGEWIQETSVEKSLINHSGKT